MVTILCLLLFVSSCSKNVRKQKELDQQLSPVKEHLETATMVLEQDLLEAKLIDIPLPFGLEPIECFTCIDNKNNKVIIGYYAKFDSQQELKMFYKKEMECLGWQERNCFEGKELLLIFDRPGKMCIVSIRPEKNEKVELVLFVGQQDMI